MLNGRQSGMWCPNSYRINPQYTCTPVVSAGCTVRWSFSVVSSSILVSDGTRRLAVGGSPTEWLVWRTVIYPQTICNISYSHHFFNRLSGSLYDPAANTACCPPPPVVNCVCILCWIIMKCSLVGKCTKTEFKNIIKLTEISKKKGTFLNI